VGRQSSIISKKFLAHENGTQQDPYNPTWELKPLHVIILLSSSHKYVYTHTHTYTVHKSKDFGNSGMWSTIMGTEF